MKIQYDLDLSEKSVSYPHTPGLDFKGLPFCVEIWGHFYGGKKYYTERQGYDRFLLFYTVSGQGLLKYRNGEYLIGPGQAAAIHCDEYQHYMAVSDAPWEFLWVHYNGSAAREYFTLLNGDAFKVITLPDAEQFHRALEEMKKTICSKDVLADIRLSKQMTGIMTTLLESRFSPSAGSRYQDQASYIRIVTEYIHDNYCRKTTMEDLLRQVHVSKYHFVRTFKKYTGKSPYEYLLNYRITQSKVLLKDAGISVNEVCDRIGYSNINNFIRDFKKYEGMTPVQYRRLGIR